MEKNIALEALVEITNNNLGFVPSTPTEFNDLSRLIHKKTGRSLSLSSIKRIWGYVRYEGFPSLTTLNTLAQYNGFKDWETFKLSNSATVSMIPPLLKNLLSQPIKLQSVTGCCCGGVK